MAVTIILNLLYTQAVSQYWDIFHIYMSNAGILYTQTNFVGVGSAYEYQFQRKYFITMQCMAMEVFLGNSYSAFRACVNYAPLGLITLGESTSHSVWRKYKINNWYYPKHFNLAPHTFMINNYWSLRINSVKTGNIKQCLWLKIFEKHRMLTSQFTLKVFKISVRFESDSIQIFSWKKMYLKTSFSSSGLIYSNCIGWVIYATRTSEAVIISGNLW